MNDKQQQEFINILKEAGYQRNVSFKSNANHQLVYLAKMANDRFGGNFSAAVIECVMCHEYMVKKYGDWRTMERRPSWLNEIMNQLKSMKVIASDGSQDEQAQEAVSQALQLSEKLFE